MQPDRPKRARVGRRQQPLEQGVGELDLPIGVVRARLWGRPEQDIDATVFLPHGLDHGLFDLDLLHGELAAHQRGPRHLDEHLSDAQELTAVGAQHANALGAQRDAKLHSAPEERGLLDLDVEAAVRRGEGRLERGDRERQRERPRRQPQRSENQQRAEHEQAGERAAEEARQGGLSRRIRAGTR